ncbi:uridine diphosphate glucose pyrophosphatase-like isoform X1 [Cimex lectularius]|uniref:Uridine diphosphate glucose pyrophosphatase NUDT14 n=1 Tax=Cimex lectularius TaxID=79782 RepID=A0A8I6RQ36_CIMLE|nr:uridine diphosphate glucose pyrophosphatase-like isoform X1 [Cimex lectularius]
MLNIKDVTLSPMEDSIYVVPFRMNYTQDNVSKTWDLIKTHNSVTIILYNTTQNVLVCVKQFRPGVYFNSILPEDRKETIDTSRYPPKLGMSLEFCSGIVDKEKSLAEIAVEEAYEECGYKINKNSLEKVKSYRNAIGVAGETTTLFYTEVTDDMKTGPGGGVENELIEIVHLRMDQIEKIIREDEASSSNNVSGEFLFGLMWFYNRQSKL